MHTEELIDLLSADARPVRPLASPWRRTGVWFALSAAYTVVLIAVMSPGSSPFAGRRLSPFWLEQAAAIATGIAAAAAACLSVVPGRSRRWQILPAIPVAAWLGILALGCVRDWAQRGGAGMIAHADWPCTVAMLAGAFLPIGALMLAARRGAPLTPTATAALVGLAGAALSSVVACVSRPALHPTTMTVVVWHLGTVLLMMAVTAWTGRRLLAWPQPLGLARAIDGATPYNRRVR
jgi:hypothetical protein